MTTEDEMKELLNRCDSALFVARRAGRKLWTAYQRREVDGRMEYDELIKISENEENGGSGAISDLIVDIRKIPFGG